MVVTLSSFVVLVAIFAASFLAVVVLIKKAPLLEERDETRCSESAIEEASNGSKCAVSGSRMSATPDTGGNLHSPSSRS